MDNSSCLGRPDNHRHTFSLRRIVVIAIVGAFLFVDPALAINKDDPVLVGAGDVAECWLETFSWFSGAAATANLLDDIEGVVFTTGDNVYEDGTAREFRNCYDRPGADTGHERARRLGIMTTAAQAPPRTMLISARMPVHQVRVLQL